MKIICINFEKFSDAILTLQFPWPNIAGTMKCNLNWQGRGGGSLSAGVEKIASTGVVLAGKFTSCRTF